MRFTSAPSTASALLLLSIGAQSSPIDSSKSFLTKRGVNVTTWKPTPFSGSSTLAKSSNYVELQKVQSGNPKHNAAQLQGLCTRGSAPTAGVTALIGGQEFAIPIKIGTESFQVILDTGSSDTWVVGQGFKCYNVENDTAVPYADCGFGPAYSQQASFKTIPHEFFNITYGDGEFLNGVFGTETVTIAGVAVHNQTMAVAQYGGWNGDKTTSGLTGFAYPALTSAYSSNGTQEIYNPVFTTMYEDHLVAPYFSLAILRDTSGPAGYLTLGGLPPLDFDMEFATTPIEVTTVMYYPQAYDFYTISVDSFKLNGQTLGNLDTASYIVDSGTTLNYLPNNISQAINNAFVPPASYDDTQGAYAVDCNAKAPQHSIIIAGKAFEINPLDMILNVGNNSCISGITDGGMNPGEDIFILGDVFQKNVVSVFDVGAVEMKFAPHSKYTSNDKY